MLLAACGSGAPVEQSVEAQSPGGEQPPPLLASPVTSEQEPPATEASQDVAEPATEPTATVDVSPNLRASDPSTVNLASGEPLLVEFFAFW